MKMGRLSQVLSCRFQIACKPPRHSQSRCANLPHKESNPEGGLLAPSLAAGAAPDPAHVIAAVEKAAKAGQDAA